jgi:hypothetical protein
MTLDGATTGAGMTALERQPGVANYLVGRDRSQWLTNVPMYGRVDVKGVYPGTDLTYYGTEGQLEYDFVVAPGADPAAIHLRFEGALPTLADNGDLLLAPEPGSAPVRLRKPVLYQEIGGVRRTVEGAFQLAASEVSFRVGAYDRGAPLTIDPVVVYSSYLGGSSQSSPVNGAALNASGQLYVAGTTNAVDFPTTPGVIFPTCPVPESGSTKCGASSQSAAFVAKIAANGQSLVYSTYLGGSGSGNGGSGADTAVGVAVTANDEAWVAGNTNSDNFPITPDALQLNCSPVWTDFNNNTGQYTNVGPSCGNYNTGGEYVYGNASPYVVKLNSTGTAILYGTFLGGTQSNYIVGVALDTAGNVYVAGSAVSPNPSVVGPVNGTNFNFPVTAGAYQGAGSQFWTPFVSEISADGHTLLYSSFIGGCGPGSCSSYVSALAVGGGKMSIGGETNSVAFPTTAGAVQKTCPTTNGNVCQAYTGFLATFDPTQSGAASLLNATYLGGSQPAGVPPQTSVGSLAADAAGNVYVSGPTTATNFPTTAGAFQRHCVVANPNNGQCSSTLFVSKLAPTGALAWSTYYGSPSGSGTIGGNPGGPMAVDSSSNVYLSLNAQNAGDLPIKNSLQGWTNGSAVVAELSSTGKELLFGTFYGTGSGGAVFPTALAVDAADSIYVAGYASGSVPLVAPYESTSAGGYFQGFFAKIATKPLATTNVLTASLKVVPAGQPVTFTSTVGGALVGRPPTGTVTFDNGTTVLGTATLSGGVATFTTSSLAPGKYSVKASYGGDANNRASTSAAVRVTEQ